MVDDSNKPKLQQEDIKIIEAAVVEALLKDLTVSTRITIVKRVANNVYSRDSGTPGSEVFFLIDFPPTYTHLGIVTDGEKHWETASFYPKSVPMFITEPMAKGTFTPFILNATKEIIKRYCDKQM